MRIPPAVLFLLIIALLVTVGYFLSNYLLYFAISLVISAMIAPIVEVLSRFRIYGLGLNRALAVALSFLLFISFLSLIVLIFVPLVNDQIELIKQTDFNELVDALDEPIAKVEEALISNGVVNQKPGFLHKQINDGLGNLVSEIKIDSILNNLVSITGSVAIGILSVTFICFFLLFEHSLLKNLILSFVPNAYFEVVASTVYKIENLLGSYLRGLLLEVFFVFSIVATGLNIIGVEYSFTLAAFAGLANLIPYLGPLIGTLFGLSISLANAPGDVLSFNEYVFFGSKVLAAFMVAQLVDNLVLQPLIYSRSVKAHPLEIFTMIFLGGAIGGVLGMISAIPAYTVIRVTVLEFKRAIKEFKVFSIKKQVNLSNS